jgi:4-hydroxythreonine-4-phosphate dehydrogenase
MKKTILILSSDPHGINYEIIKKSISFFDKKNNKNEYVFIGDKKDILTSLPNNKKKILNILNVPKDNNSTKKYLKNCFDKAFNLLKNKKANAIINLPLNKKNLPKNFPGVTEYISHSFNVSNKETMLLYADSFSVCPNTTHIPLSQASKKLTKKNIIKNVININKFYKKIIGIKRPKLSIMGFNPHNGADFKKKLEEQTIITPALNVLKRKKINITGPIPSDSAFNQIKLNKINCLIGNYHDQVLPTFKYINKFKAINITLGLPFLRISPDHGPAENIKGKNLANPESFLFALHFFEKYSKKI